MYHLIGQLFRRRRFWQNGYQRVQHYVAVISVLQFVRFLYSQIWQETVRKVQSRHCMTTAVLHFVLCTVPLIAKNLQHAVSYVSVMFLVSDSISVAILMYYRIKFIVGKNAVRNIVDYIQQCGLYRQMLWFYRCFSTPYTRLYRMFNIPNAINNL